MSKRRVGTPGHSPNLGAPRRVNMLANVVKVNVRRSPRSVERRFLVRHKPQLHEYEVLQQRDFEHPAQHLGSDQR